MRTSVICTGLAAAAFAAPAQAHSPGHHPHHVNGRHSTAASCEPHAVGYHARGTLVAVNLTQTAGQGTERRSDDRYDGTVQVTVARANHHAPTGVQTFTLDDARVGFYDVNHDGVADQPSVGDRVQLHGKVTRLRRGCDASGFTPQVTVRYVRFHGPRPAEAHVGLAPRARR